MKSGRITGLAVLAVIAFMAGPAAAFELGVEKVTDRIYALIGSTGPRTAENHALNNTMGFIVTPEGVVLIDSGASVQGAALIEASIAKVTDKPVKWVINTGSQDHRWLGNGYFADKGARIIALSRTVQSQKDETPSHLKRLESVLGDRLAGTTPVNSPEPLPGDRSVLTFGGIGIEIVWPGAAHFPNDVIVFVRSEKTVFAGDLVFMDRMLGVQGGGASKVASWAEAFRTMAALAPEHVVPGHGAPGDLAKARRDTGDYLDWLVANVRPAAQNMEDINAVVARLADTPFRHLEHFDSWHKTNVNRAFLQFEAE